MQAILLILVCSRRDFRILIDLELNQSKDTTMRHSDNIYNVSLVSWSGEMDKRMTIILSRRPSYASFGSTYLSIPSRPVVSIT